MVPVPLVKKFKFLRFRFDNTGYKSGFSHGISFIHIFLIKKYKNKTKTVIGGDVAKFHGFLNCFITVAYFCLALEDFRRKDGTDGLVGT
jgi:hypothetical protein